MPFVFILFYKYVLNIMMFENILQMPSIQDDWSVWLIIGGRGLGKTTSAAYHISQMIKDKKINNIAFIGRTASDVINTMVHNGLGKFMNCRVDKNRKAIRDESGDILGYYFSQLCPNKIRGFSFDFAWIDELSTFDIKNIHILWNNLMLCLRIGISRVIVTTTPGSLDLIQSIMSDRKTYVTSGTSYDNCNLSKNFIDYVNSMTKDDFYQQEIMGQTFSGYDLWSPNDIIYKDTFEGSRALYVIGVDPAVSKGTTGIILSAILDQKAYVLADHSISCPVRQWIRIIHDISVKHTGQIQIVLEINQGGQALKDILEISGIQCPIISKYASESKYQRNLKTYSLYESKSVYHARKIESLEKEMFYRPADRVDALTWSLTPLYEIHNKFSVDIIYGY